MDGQGEHRSLVFPVVSGVIVLVALGLSLFFAGERALNLRLLGVWWLALASIFWWVVERRRKSLQEENDVTVDDL